MTCEVHHDSVTYVEYTHPEEFSCIIEFFPISVYQVVPPEKEDIYAQPHKLKEEIYDMKLISILY